MSLFLVYFETGKPIPPMSVQAPLVQHAIVVEFSGRSKSPNLAFTVTDGVSSERLLRQGNKLADRLGQELRQALIGFVRMRLASGARPALMFDSFDGPVHKVHVDWSKRMQVSAKDLERKIIGMRPREVVEVLEEPSVS
ncbi:hypothetical protein [Polyangium aurulentum]|uniref:hypothetical protein n=1 Tax=Polyangium aurulentum TaxID=2567896 RepID=UPI0010ADF51F|nr:hypothetical protein [Polyangium aurulentum]UQA57462.1 hypothetical protein E8A73_040285 [Polyangium aurulentum]